MLFGGRRKIEQVSSGHSGTLAFNQLGQLWVAFIDYHAGSLRLAQSIDRGKWNVSTVDSVIGLLGSCPGLAFGEENTVHIAYCDMIRQIEGAKAGALCYARIGKDKISLHVLDKGKVNCCGVYPSMALSKSGRIAISYHYDAAGDRDLNQEIIKLAFWDREKWNIKPLRESAPGGHVSSVVFDASERVHIAFNRRKSTGACYEGPLYYASEVDGEFLLEEVDSRKTRRPSLTMSENGRLHLSYVLHREEHLAYATVINGKWSITDLGPASANSYASIALDKLGNPLIVFNEERSLKLAAFSSGSWRIETIWASKDDWRNPEYPEYPTVGVDRKGTSLVCFTMWNSLNNSYRICLLRM